MTGWNHFRDMGATVEILAQPRPAITTLDIQDESGGRRIRPRDRVLIVGRGPLADIRIDDPTVSTEHCTVRVVGGTAVVCDLKSKNGTFIGSARVHEMVVGEGALVTVGRSSIAFASDGDAADDTIAEPLPGVVGASQAMRRVAMQVRRLAGQSAPVLIGGESGTGKELVARAIHALGPRSRCPYVTINVAALPRELIESEMFGHERGAFTGAVSQRAGAFREAQGGSLFLDEIGELPIDSQAKLLRALDGYEVKRVGSTGAGKRVDVRVIAATHVPLEDRVRTGRFRRDLFHRLEVFVVDLPPLRARRGDIAVIAKDILRRAAPEIGARELTSAALARLTTHPWPGNVRELRNVLYRAASNSTSDERIDLVDIEAALKKRRDAPTEAPTSCAAQALMREYRNNMSAAARAAGCPRTTFRRLLSR